MAMDVGTVQEVLDVLKWTAVRQLNLWKNNTALLTDKVLL